MKHSLNTFKDIYYLQFVQENQRKVVDFVTVSVCRVGPCRPYTYVAETVCRSVSSALLTVSWFSFSVAADVDLLMVTPDYVGFLMANLLQDPKYHKILEVRPTKQKPKKKRKRILEPEESSSSDEEAKRAAGISFSAEKGRIMKFAYSEESKQDFNFDEALQYGKVSRGHYFAMRDYLVASSTETEKLYPRAVSIGFSTG